MEAEPSVHDDDPVDALEHIYEDQTPNHSATTDEPQDTTSESSFMPGSAAISSTPARVGRSSDASTAGPSWMSSMDSPLMRLNREMESLTRDDQPPAAYLAASTRDRLVNVSTTDAIARQEELSSAGDVSTDSYQESDSLLSDPPTPPPPPKRRKSKGKSQPLLQNVLRRRLSAAPDDGMRSPRKIPELKKQNPYLPTDTPGSKWDGTVDLSRDYRRDPEPSSSLEMSQLEEPQASIQLTRPPRVTGNAPTLGRTPKKQAAQRITGDMLRSIVNSQRKPVLTRPPLGEDTISSLSTPPSMSRYGRADSSTGTSSMATPPSMSRYQQDDEELSPLATPPSISKYVKLLARLQPTGTSGSVLPRSRSPSPSPAPASYSRYTRQASADSGDTLNSIMDLPSVSRYTAAPTYITDDDTTSSGFTDTFAGRYVARPIPGSSAPTADTHEEPSIASLRSMMREAGLEGFDVQTGQDSPSDGAADLSGDSSFGQTMRPEQLALFSRGANDSFDSEGSSDSFDDTRPGGAGAALRFAPAPNGGDGFDDSFDDDDEIPTGGAPPEETVFGLAPQRRYRQPELVLHGDALLAHTTDFARAIGEGNDIAQTPTPASWRDS